MMRTKIGVVLLGTTCSAFLLPVQETHRSVHVPYTTALQLVPPDVLLPPDVAAFASSSMLDSLAVPAPLANIWDSYNVVLADHPLYTKCSTSLVGFTLGDLIAQNYVEKDNEDYDVMRTLRLASFGLLIHGTSGHYFYGFLDSTLPGNSGATVAEKVLIDQVFWAPVFTFIFFGYNLFLEGKSLPEFVDKCKADLFAGVRGSWSFWGPAHAVNFALIPPAQRLLYINVLQVIYNIFLSFLGNKKVETATDPAVATDDSE